MKKSRKFVGTIALMLVLMFTLTGCGDTMLGRFMSIMLGVDRNTVAYEDMEYKRPDGDAILTRMDELIVEMNATTEYGQMAKIEKELGEILTGFNTAYVLAMIKTYQITNDEAVQAEFDYCEEVYPEIQLRQSQYLRFIVEGPYASKYEEMMGERYMQSIKNTLLLSNEEVLPLKKQRATLEADYNKALTSMTLEYNGVSYTMDDIINMIQNADSDLGRQLYVEYYKTNAKKFTDIYAEMVKLDKEMASKLGFASAAEMYYLQYSRDYTPDDAMAYAQNTKDIFADLVADMDGKIDYSVEVKYDTAFAGIPEIMSKMDPELRESWDFMINNNLYDYEARENKNPNVAFTISIAGYDAPFCYGYYEDNLRSASTVIHEFGHFYADYVNYNRMEVFSLDKAEVYSQGLELLSMNYYDKITDFAQESEMAVLNDFGNPLTYQIALEEFSQKAYAMDSFDSNTIAKLYTDIMDSYGLGGLTDEFGIDYSWFRVTHLFSQPFYTVSYWTSAVVALQMWSAGQEDYDVGLKMYMDMLHGDQTLSFMELVKEVGLGNPSDPAVLSSIAQDLIEKFGLNKEDYPAAA